MIQTYILFDGIDCGENAKPQASLWVSQVPSGSYQYAKRYGYSLDTGTGDDVIVFGFECEEDARAAAVKDVRERMIEASIDADASVAEVQE